MSAIALALLACSAWLGHELVPAARRSSIRKCTAITAMAGSANRSAAFRVPRAAARFWRRMTPGSGEASGVGARGSRRGGKIAAGGLLATGTAGGGVLAARRLRPKPVVLLHGILDRAENMEESARWVRRALPGAYVRCVEVGNGIVDSLRRPMDWQLRDLAATLASDPKLSRGMHIIGHSQGALLGRAFVQRYDYPRVYTLISWAGPQAGYFGVPELEPLLEGPKRWTSAMWYTPVMQARRGRCDSA